MNIFIYVKRTLARIIDIIVPTIITLLGLFFSNSSNQSLREFDNEFILIFIFIFYFLFMLISIFQFKNKTYGDLIFKIHLVPLYKKQLTILNVLSREIFIAILIFISIEYDYGWIVIIIGLMPFGKNNENQIPLIVADIICKNTYIDDKVMLDK